MFRASNGLVVEFVSSAFGKTDYRLTNKNLSSRRVTVDNATRNIISDVTEVERNAIHEYLEHQRQEFFEWCRERGIDPNEYL